MGVKMKLLYLKIYKSCINTQKYVCSYVSKYAQMIMLFKLITVPVKGVKKGLIRTEFIT